MVGRKISFAITTYNSSRFVPQAIVSPLQDKRVSEVVISDDASNDFWVMDKFKRFEKVKVFRNGTNLGGFLNKFEAISRCRNDWAILLDSDNWLIDGYVDALYNLPSWNEKTIYCPDGGGAKMDFSSLAGKFIDKENVGKFLKEDPKTMRKLLNTGNYFVNTKTYLRINREGWTQHTPCAITFNYLWLKSGGRLFVVPRMRYCHRLRKDSYWRLNAKTMKPILNKIIEELL